ncbi:hypothetical protein TNCT6_58380 [Streptomyces sp. 6-11-2]|nr:hypothetical protein TNCT6_58380 [Streptomyces sp. 6-11-2]
MRYADGGGLTAAARRRRETVRKPARPPGIMGVMDTPTTGWISIAVYENLPGRLHPMAAARA